MRPSLFDQPACRPAQHREDAAGIRAPTLSARSANGGMSPDMTFILIRSPWTNPEQLLAGS